MREREEKKRKTQVARHERNISLETQDLFFFHPGVKRYPLNPRSGIFPSPTFLPAARRPPQRPDRDMTQQEDTSTHSHRQEREKPKPPLHF